jgi:hypothetical protein
VLADLDPPLFEPRFAVAEEQRPQAPEALVVAELGEALAGCLESLTPAGKRPHVMRRHVFEPDGAQVGHAGYAALDHRS